MESSKGHLDVAKSIRVIEWLKAEMVGSVASLLKSLVNGGEDLIADCLAGIIMTAYVLGKRVGIAYSKVDQRLKEESGPVSGTGMKSRTGMETSPPSSAI